MGKHVSTFSLGGGSWLTARVVQRELVRPGDEHVLVFTDTLYEDADAYRFGLQAALNVFDRKANWIPVAEDFPDYRADPETPIEVYAGNPAWRAFLAQLRDRAAEAIPELVWLVEGRDPWEVYRDVRFLGNSSVDPCSRVAKREVLDNWVGEICDPADTAIYFGIGSAEKHRYEGVNAKTGKPSGIKPRWAAKGYNAQAPLIGRIEGDLSPQLYMNYQGLKPSRMYRLGYSHDNCGGNCCKAGIRQWTMRHNIQPDRYAYDAMMERKIAAFLGTNVTFLEDRRGGERQPMSLDQLAERIRSDPNQPLPLPEPGDTGCGCMTEEPEAA
jgi:hypothetical protein